MCEQNSKMKILKLNTETKTNATALNNLMKKKVDAINRL